MSNEDRNLTEKIPHSGEPVVTEFNKPLAQAYEEGLIKTPETSQDIPQTSEKKKSKKGLIGAGVGLAGLALGGSLFLGLGNNANGGEQAPEPNQPVPTDVAEPGGETPVEVVIPEIDPANPEPVRFTEEHLIALENIPMPSEYEKYDAMSLEEFTQLPIEERLAYASYLNRDRHYLKSSYANGAEDNRYVLGSVVSEASSPEDVVFNANENPLFSFVLHFGNTTYDLDEYQKVLSAGFMDTTSKQYSILMSNEALGTGYAPRSLGESEQLTIGQVVSELEQQTLNFNGVDRLVRTVVTTLPDGTNEAGQYAYVEFVNYEGEQTGAYVRVN